MNPKDRYLESHTLDQDRKHAQKRPEKTLGFHLWLIRDSAQVEIKAKTEI